MKNAVFSDEMSHSPVNYQSIRRYVPDDSRSTLQSYLCDNLNSNNERKLSCQDESKY
jgi:hypothetical protein